MRTLKKVLLVIGIILLVLVLVAYLLPSTVKVQRSLQMNANQQLVFEQVNHLREWEKWSPWHKIDTAMKIVYANPDFGVGASYTWYSKHPRVGNGKLTITGVKPYDSLATEMDFMEHGTAKAYYLFKPVNNGTNVIWVMDNKMGNNPFARYFGLFMDKMIGPDFERGLQNLKNVVERMDATPSYHADTITMVELPFISTIRKSKMTDISKTMGEAYGELMNTMQTLKLKQSNSPFAIYLNYNTEEVEFEAGIPVDRVVKTKGNIKSGILPSSKAVYLDYFGPYTKLENGHNQINKYIAERNFTIVGNPMEVYVTDPMTEKDSTKWLTKIYYRIK